MSGDEIIFEDVTYRQPQKRPRPDHDRRWACLSYELPVGDDLPIFLDHRTADAIERHALRDTTVELGGILLGHECLDESSGSPFVWVTQAIEAKHYENTEASFTYTHDSWEEISRDRDRLFPDLDIVGWYHTHPDFGIFLSGHDLFLHRHFFGQPLQVAYVIDPIRQARGFFRWRDDALEQVGGYFLTADRGDRVALARFVNDLENFPPPAVSGGGALSPRLEAELIAMLTRPAHAPQAAADRAQTAAVFSLLGVVLGVIGLAGVLWLNTLTRQVQEQASSLKSLEASLAKSAADRPIELTAERVEAKEAALNSLLREVRADGSTGRFTALYEAAVRDREVALRELRKQAVSHDGVYALNQRLGAELDEAKRQAASLRLDVRKLEPIRREADVLRAQLKGSGDRVADKDILRKYDRAWYAAIGAGALSLLLALALIAAVARAAPVDGRGAEPPHSIS